jgi:hypothetical protein
MRGNFEGSPGTARAGSLWAKTVTFYTGKLFIQ